MATSPPELEPFSLDPTVTGLLKASSRVRSSGPSAFILAGAMYAWLESGHQILGAAIALAELSLIATIGRFRARVPRRARPLEYDDRAIALLAKSMRRPKPKVLVVPGDRLTAQIRGTNDSPVLVISRGTSLFWTKNPGKHAVQLCHEMAHVWARDLTGYYFRSTAIIIFGTQVVLDGWRNYVRILDIYIIAFVLALLSLQSYLRSREHAADFIAAQILGANARDELPQTSIGHASRLPFLRTHPTATERRQAFDKTDVLFRDLRLPMFAFGFLSIFCVDLGTAIVRLESGAGPSAALNVVAPLAAGIVGWIVGGVLTYGIATVEPKTIRAWCRALLLGQAVCLFLFRRPDAGWKLALLLLIATRLLARACAMLSSFAFLVCGHIETLWQAGHRLAQGTTVFISWLLITELTFHGQFSSIAAAI